MKNYNTRSNDTGISESIGFMLIFTIVIAGIALVTLYGYPMLLQQQMGAEEKIMEKNMIVLQNDFKSLAYKTVPYKETSLKIGGGSLTVYNESDSLSSFTISNSSGPIVNNFRPGELLYESVSAQTNISLQNGAVVMRPRIQSGSTMLAEPRWFYDAPTQTMVINLINITRPNLMAKEGIGTVRMRLGNTTYRYESPVSSPVTVTYSPSPGQDYSVAWDNYFTKIGMQRTTGTPGLGTPVTYTLPTTRTLVIKTYEVHIDAI
jgi:hypothetical protein